MNHEHDSGCRHDLRFCYQCDAPYCGKCDASWSRLVTTITFTPVASPWDTTTTTVPMTTNHVHAIRGGDYPSLAAVWENDSDDAAFGEEPA